MRPDPHPSSDRTGRRQRCGSAVGAGAVPSKFADPNIARSQALAPVDRETLLQTTNKATDHRHTDGAHHRHEQSGSSSASMTNRLAMVVIWSDAQQFHKVSHRCAAGSASPNASLPPRACPFSTGESSTFAGSRSSWSAAQVSAPISTRCHERHFSRPGVWVAQFHRMRCASCLSEVVALKCWSGPPRRCSITTARPCMKID